MLAITLRHRKKTNEAKKKRKENLTMSLHEEKLQSSYVN